MPSRHGNCDDFISSCLTLDVLFIKNKKLYKLAPKQTFFFFFNERISFIRQNKSQFLLQSLQSINIASVNSSQYKTATQKTTNTQ